VSVQFWISVLVNLRCKCAALKSTLAGTTTGRLGIFQARAQLVSIFHAICQSAQFAKCAAQFKFVHVQLANY